MHKTAFLILTLWAVGLVKCVVSVNKCHESERRHHVWVVYESNTKKCAGTLIHKQWVITAKDCYGGIDGALKVQLHDQKQPLAIKSSDILSPLYEPILLLKLPKPEKDIEPAVLPSGDCITPREGDGLQVSGYSFKAEGVSDTNLKCLDVKVSECGEMPDFTKSKRIFCGERTVCKDSECQDDYGSGLLKKVTVSKKSFFKKEKQADMMFGVLIESQSNKFIFVDICYGPIKKWLDDVLK
ncbi:granzyme M-like isoform X2 [Colossoma macropomum]|uniref:granzyme M-like isoform X2 n=1 Tax=Colossoma macropomum TaxID=42526 RepID=UPI001864810E|nr:granzyme M-like isoform X2 [Colossoma macropomum]